jgi:hypothetical protein
MQAPAQLEKEAQVTTQSRAISTQDPKEFDNWLKILMRRTEETRQEASARHLTAHHDWIADLMKRTESTAQEATDGDTHFKTLNELSNSPPLLLAAANRDMLYTRNESLRFQDEGVNTRKQRLPLRPLRPLIIPDN